MTRKNVLIRHERPEWTEWYAEKLKARFPDFGIFAAHTLGDAMSLAGQTHVYVGIGPQMSPRLVAAMPKLEWVQSLTTGVDNLLAMQAFPEGVPITRCAGVQGPQMSELALLLMMSLLRDFPVVLENQKEARWDRRPQPLLWGKTLCLLGLGSIAETLAKYCTTMGMTVIGISDGRNTAPHVDRIYKRNELREAVREADFLVVLLPLSPATRHIVDASVLAAMKPTAYLINIARGGCVDENSLLEALQAGTIAGAGTDVFEIEPLPPEDPLWNAPNLILTPHVGGYADIYHEQCFPILVENFEAYAAGGPTALKNAVRR